EFKHHTQFFPRQGASNEDVIDKDVNALLRRFVLVSGNLRDDSLQDPTAKLFQNSFLAREVIEQMADRHAGCLGQIGQTRFRVPLGLHAVAKRGDDRGSAISNASSGGGGGLSWSRRFL